MLSCLSLFAAAFLTATILPMQSEALLASWGPIIGDPLAVVAGVMGEPLNNFMIIVAITKATGYLVVLAATLAWLEGAGEFTDARPSAGGSRR